MLDNFIKSYAQKVTKLSLFVAIATVIVVVMSAMGGKNLFFNNDYRIFFSPDDEKLLAFENLQDTYTKNDNVIFVLAPKEGEVFTPNTLAAIEDLTDRAWKTPYSIRVDSLSNYQLSESIEDDMSVGDLYEDGASLSSEDIQKIKEVSLSEPLLLHRLISEKADVTALNITMEFPLEEANEAGEMVLSDPTKQVEEV